MDATLVRNPDDTYTLTFHQSGERWEFSADRYLTATVDRNDNRIGYGYDADNQLVSLTDTHGRVTTFARTTVCRGSLVTTVTDPAGRVWQYGYDGEYLVSVTHPAGKATG